MNEHCEMVLDIQVKQAEGALLDEQDLAIVTAHLKKCPKCRLETDLFKAAALPSSLETPELDEFTRRRLNDDVLAEAAFRRRLSEKRSHFKKRFGVALALVCALVIFSFVGTIFFWGKEQMIDNPSRPFTVTPLVSHSETAMPLGTIVKTGAQVRNGRAHLNSRNTLYSGAPLEVFDEDAVFQLLNGTDLVVSEGAKLTVKNRQGEGIAVNLKEGSLLAKVTPLAKREGFEVITPHGKARVTGTVFSVASTASSASVSVLRGAVTVSNKEGLSGIVRAGETRHLGERQACWTSENQERLLRDKLKQLEQTLLGPHLISSGEKNNRSSEGVRALVSTRDAKNAKETNTAESPEVLLNRARELRATGDFVAVRNAYHKLVVRFPSSNEAAIALVSLGEIELSNLNNPADALTFFDRYLAEKKRGALIQEALWGRCRALRALGWDGEERVCLLQFTHRFPSAPQSAHNPKK